MLQALRGYNIVDGAIDRSLIGSLTQKYQCPVNGNVTIGGIGGIAPQD